ncbi:YbaK/EbsC family protein [Phytoactinopolyspora limicola]|uniref:YbaK/EbsC family protein n=1 Tax=Phytoactinopolyspora limicola TaxID=2715536 RepID=UPI001A9CA6C3|nr:YbaK/EbsC family protein [Phytoactinopolyspora limicola]
MTEAATEGIGAHPNVQRVRSALQAAGVERDIVVLPESAPTAAAAAQQLGCDVGAIANSLIFTCDGAPLLVLTSGAHRADTKLLSAAAGSRVGRADAEFVREHTGQPIGGVAPVGHGQPVRTFVDRWLARYDEVWAAAGHPYTVFPTTFDELLAITGGTVVDVQP